jgi:hypothetical protein
MGGGGEEKERTNHSSGHASFASTGSSSTHLSHKRSHVHSTGAPGSSHTGHTSHAAHAGRSASSALELGVVHSGSLLLLVLVNPLHQAAPGTSPTSAAISIITYEQRKRGEKVEKSDRTFAKSVLMNWFLTFSFVSRGQNSSLASFLRRMSWR